MPHLWATEVGSPLGLNGAIDGITKFVTTMGYSDCENYVACCCSSYYPWVVYEFAQLLCVIQSQYRQNNENISIMSLRG